MGPQYGPAPKKKSHWFAKTLAAIVVLAGGAAILRGKVGAFKNFDKTKPLEEGAKFKEQATYYGKKAVAVVGDFINEKVVAPILKLFKGKPKAGRVYLVYRRTETDGKTGNKGLLRLFYPGLS